MLINDDKNGVDNNTVKVRTQIEREIQNFQTFFAKNVCVSWLETLTRTLKLRHLKSGYRIIIKICEI